jgi:colanic acid biosynthesis glycosyl transferase WcaI
MNFLLLNQCFYPDVAATGQYLTDLAVELVERGHRVTVIASDRGYDNPTKRFPRQEEWRGVSIIRIPSLSLGKRTRWRRALNFGSFLLSCAWRLLLLPRFDAVVALTSPPLISFLAAVFVRLRGGRLFSWVMDLNPDEAIAAGWLQESSLLARVLNALLLSSLRTAQQVVVLDRFMKERLVAKGIAESKVLVLPPWELSNAVRYDEAGRQRFRELHGLSDKHVVMYAGNHSPCHPLETLLETARGLSDQHQIAFCFVGGGSEQDKVRTFAATHELKNIHCLPYQPLAELSGVLSAADLQVVVMGDKFVGIVHPCKVYNILAVGVPILYIGPEASHVADIAGQSGELHQIYLASHGDIAAVTAHVNRSAAGGNLRRAAAANGAGQFSRAALLPVLLNSLEAVTSSAPVRAVGDFSDFNLGKH